MRIIIRADGNREVAMGHIMRCLSIADALRREGAQVCFVTAGEETQGLIRERGYENIVLGTSFRDMEGELSSFTAYFQKAPAQRILVDSYFVTGSYLKALSALARTAYLDDMGRPVYPVDLLINYNNYANDLPYARRYEEEGLSLPKLLLGCAYVPLREEFQKGLRSRVRGQVSDVLISTGGGDRVNAAGRLCARLLLEKRRGKRRGIRYHVVCGPLSAQKEELYAISKAHPDFIIHENVTNMSELMRSCDAAVSAAGGTMYELCSMRLPTVCFTFAENQRQMAEHFDKTSEIRNAGSLEEAGEKTLDALLDRLSELENDAALRGRIREQMALLTDGFGAGRIARELIR